VSIDSLLEPLFGVHGWKAMLLAKERAFIYKGSYDI
jgi:hypothetical protein